MSGGSFNYLYNRDPEDLVGGSGREDLDSMLAQLEELPYGAAATAPVLP
jgi:hypothetical protein